MLVRFLFWLIALNPNKCPADPQTLDLAKAVANVQERLQQAQGLSLEVEVRRAKGAPIAARIMALRPNFLKVETQNQSFYCDGKNAW